MGNSPAKHSLPKRKNKWGKYINRYFADGSEAKIGDVVVYKDIHYIVLHDDNRGLALAQLIPIYVDFTITVSSNKEIMIPNPTVWQNEKKVVPLLKCPSHRLSNYDYGKWLIANWLPIQQLLDNQASLL